MGGNSPQTTQQTQSSVSSPWSEAQPLLRDLINQYGGQSTAVTPAQSAAAGRLTEDTSGIPNMGAGATGAVNRAFDFSAAPQMGMLGDSFRSLQGNLSADASGANLDPWATPGFGDAMGRLNKDITNQVGNRYAASGRSPSGSGSFAGSLGRGLGEGEGALIQNQFNQNKANMLNANSTLFNAGNTTAGGQAGLGMLGVNAGLSGIGAIPGAAGAYAAPGATALQGANTAYGVPWGNLAQLLRPAATMGSLGGQTSGTGTSTTTPANNTMSNILGGVSSGIGLLSLFSDERLKTDVKKVGMLNDGQNVYRFKFKGDPAMHIGLLAQEVEKHEPKAVREHESGYKMVDHEKATERAAEMRRAA